MAKKVSPIKPGEVTKTEIALIQKITKAQLKLESALTSHYDQCSSSDDSGAPVGCNCGADRRNQMIHEAMIELNLEQ